MPELPDRTSRRHFRSRAATKFFPISSRNLCRRDFRVWSSRRFLRRHFLRRSIRLRQRPINDLYKPFTKDKSDKHLLKISGYLTVIIGIVQIVIAIGFMKTASSALNLALSVASLINGPILGVFLVGTFLKKAKEIHALDRNGGEHFADDLHLTRNKDRVDLVCVDWKFDDICQSHI